MREEIYGKVIRKMYTVVRVEDRCDMGCTGISSDDAGIYDVR